MTHSPLLGLIIKHSDATQAARAHKELRESAKEKGKESYDPIYPDPHKNK